MTTSSKSLAMLLAYLLICQPLLPSVASAQPPAGVEELRPTHPWEPMPQPAAGEALPPGPAAPVPLSSTTWTPIGPAPLGTTSSPNSNFNVSGRITGIAANTGSANTIYVAAAGGGVWKTTDGGGTWTPLTDGQSTLSMGAIAIAPSNSSVIYAGTGEANNSADSNYGRGILVSTDGGASWTLRTAGGAFNRKSTAKIAVDPTNASVAYAAITDPGSNGLGGNNGVWKTADGGATWTNTTTAISATPQWSDVVIDPTTPTTLYAAVGSWFGDSQNGVYKSINSGTSWSLLAGAPSGTAAGRIAIAVAPSNSQVVYASAAGNGNAGSTALGSLYRFVRSDNGGSTWTNLTAGTPNYMGGQGWYDTTLIVDPTNAAIVYAAGAAGNNSILRSTNSGVNWTDIHIGGAPTNSSPHVDHHAAAFDASGRLLDGNDGGIWRLDNPTTPSWTNLNGNLATIQFQGVGLHPTNPNSAIGGSQDNGTEVFGGGVVWTETDGGDGGFAKFSQTNGARAYHQIPNDSFGTNFFRRSDDGGQTWATKTSSISVDVNAQNFYAPFAVDPGNGNRVLYGTNRVWETTNGGDTWTTISNVNTAGFNNGVNNVDAIGLAPSNTNTVYAATGGTFASSSQIFVTTNHGAAWTMHNLPVGGRVNDIQVDPANTQVAYAAINTFNGANGQVYKTVNGGTTWTNITGNLPAIPVWSLQIDSVQNRLFVGADDGVYVTTNGGTTWSRFGTGLPNAQVFQIELNAGLHILTAATHGRSAWQMSTSAAVPAPSVCSLASEFGDVNGDRRDDLLFRRTSDGLLSLYLMDGFQVLQSGFLGMVGLEWTLVAVTDFDGDGRADLLFRRTSDGMLSLYLMNGFQVLAAQLLGVVGTEFDFVGAADFNGDQRADILFRRRSDGMLALYLMNGFQVLAAQLLGSVGTEWHVRGVRDFDGDGRADILFRRSSDGMLSLYLMNGFQILAAQLLGVVGTEWNLLGVRDFNGDGRADLLFRRSDGMLSLYLMNGFQVLAAQLLGVVGPEFALLGLGDLNGDGRADMVFRRNSDGLMSLYLMNGFQVLAAQFLGSIGSEFAACYGQPPLAPAEGSEHEQVGQVGHRGKVTLLTLMRKIGAWR